MATLVGLVPKPKRRAAEPGVGGRDPKVTGQGQRQPRLDGEAVDGRDGQLVEGPHGDVERL